MKQQLTPRLNRLEPNLIIDGGMEIWPEGTSRALPDNLFQYGSVLLKALNQTTGVAMTNSRQSSVPSNTALQFSNQISKTVAGTLASGTAIGQVYVIEGYDTLPIRQSEFTVLFWVKSSVASNRTFTVRNGASTHSYLQQYSINSANTWELKALKVPALNSSPATFTKDNSMGAILSWTVVVGSQYQTSTLNSWVAGNFFSGVGENTTWLTGTTHDFSITGIVVIPGDWTSLQANPTAYNFLRAGRNFQEELAMSQRYFEKTYQTDVAPGSASELRGNLVARWPTAPSSNNELVAEWSFSVTKRAVPTITLYNPNSGAVGSWRTDVPSDVPAIVASGPALSERYVAVTNNAASSTAFHRIHIVADARF